MPTNPEHPTVLHALFGGTFDPIHYGHLRPVEALAAEVGLNRVTLLPNHVPPHRPQPEANAQQRLPAVPFMQRQQRVLANNKRQRLGGATLFTNRFQRLDGVGGGGAV
ncbi:nicotinate-nicotinamide nucleotide adenylyltransferase, partial [Microbacterium arabinogalactanolyticum]|uniref:nicotinate-nicotinamide nucleotide adenylyltransferase n=1 Tax=Microbacterium arabinogalactanolyticum TaxID=69365 RepID=UPI003CD087B4